MHIAHISDLHFAHGHDSQTHHRHDYELLAGVEAVINVRKPDWLIVSGDISNHGDELSLRHARDWLQHRVTYGDGKDTGLQFSPDRILLAPGNHDAWNLDRASPLQFGLQRSLENFHRAFTGYAKPQPGGVIWRWLPGRGIDLYVAIVDSTLLGDTDSYARWPVSRVARGKISTRQSEALLNLAEKARRGNLPIPPGRFSKSVKLLVMHHYLFEPLRGMHREPLLDVYDRKTIVQNLLMAGFNIILCGHKHFHGFDSHYWVDNLTPRGGRRLLLNILNANINGTVLPVRLTDSRGRLFPRGVSFFARIAAAITRKRIEGAGDSAADSDPQQLMAEFTSEILQRIGQPDQLKEYLLGQCLDGRLGGVAGDGEVQMITALLKQRFDDAKLRQLARDLDRTMKAVLHGVSKQRMLQVMAGSASKRFDPNAANRDQRSLNFYRFSRTPDGMARIDLERFRWNGQIFDGPQREVHECSPGEFSFQ